MGYPNLKIVLVRQTKAGSLGLRPGQGILEFQLLLVVEDILHLECDSGIKVGEILVHHIQ